MARATKAKKKVSWNSRLFTLVLDLDRKGNPLLLCIETKKAFFVMPESGNWTFQQCVENLGKGRGWAANSDSETLALLRRYS